MIKLPKIHLKISEQKSKSKFFHPDRRLVEIHDFKGNRENPDEIGVVEHSLCLIHVVAKPKHNRHVSNRAGIAGSSFSRMKVTPVGEC